ncbi:hypothetical protein EON76_04625 [bacterium]|nr:MAG: hypothetical protein EON76_04625 [bacterium]
MTIDYTPLTEPLTRIELQKYRGKDGYSFSGPRGFIISAIVALVFIVGTAGFPYIFSGGFPIQGYDFWETVNRYVFLALPIAFIVFLIAYNEHNKTKELARLNKFAISNGLSFLPKTNLIVQLGMIFNQGHSRFISPLFTMPNGVEIGNHYYTTGSGKNRRSYSWGYARIPLNRNMPHMVLDAKHNNAFSRFTNLPEIFAKDQILSLEGNFDSFFTLYAPKQYERDALYIFTPDVMVKLIDLGKEYDMEIIDNYIYLYSAQPLKLKSVTTWMTLLDITNTIGEEIIDQSENYQDERLRTEEGEYTEGAIAPQGTRLKQRVNVAGIIFIIVFIACYIYLNLSSR